MTTFPMTVPPIRSYPASYELLRQLPEPFGMVGVQGVWQVVAVRWVPVLGPRCGGGTVVEVLPAQAFELGGDGGPDRGSRAGVPSCLDQPMSMSSLWGT